MRLSLVTSTIATLFVVAIQLDVFSSLRAWGDVIMVVWLWPLAMGLTGATALALWVAAVAGALFDTHAATPFGLTVLVGLVLAYGASRLGREGVGDLDSAAWWVTPLIGATGGLCAPLLYVVGSMATFNFNLWRDGLITSMVVNAIAFFVLARPAARLARWLAAPAATRR